MFRRLLLLSCVLAASTAACAEDRVLVVGGWDYGEAVFARAARDVGMSASFVTTEETASVSADQLAGLDILFLLNLKPTGVPALKAALEQARQQNAKLVVLALDHRDSQKPLEAAGLMQRDEQIRRYWRYNGPENTRRLLRYVRREYLGSQDEVEPPVVVPDHGIFHPQAAELFTDVPAYVSWLEANRSLPAGAARIALLVQQSFLITDDTKVFEALIAAFEKRGVAVAVIFARDPKQQRTLLEAWQPSLLIDDAHASPSLKAGAEQLDVPLLKSVSLLRSTVDEWRQSPQGMLPADVSLHLLTQEVHGIIEPVLVGAQQANVAGFKLHEPIPDRVERLADRALAWLSLRTTPTADKKLAIVYYHKYLGQADLGRDSASGSFLDGPESLFRFLVALKQRGYTLTRMPKDATELLAWMKREGRNVPNWAPGDLASLVEHARPVLVPLDDYLRRYSQLGDANRAAVSAAFGPPPGDQMVWSAGDNPALVVPRIDLGNVILLPQPARGPENDEKLLHARDVPPPHQYLACYWWLQDEFRPHAVVHFGTHGTEFLLPTKANGLSQDDFGDICLGNMPNIYPWIIDNLPEAMQAKRRAYAVTVDHLTPPLETTGLSPELHNLHDDIHKFQTLEDGLLKNKYRQSITAAARAAALADGPEQEPMSNEQIDALAAQLHAIESSVTAVKLHVLGEPPAGKHRAPFLTSMLGHTFFADMADVLPVPPAIADDQDDRVAWAREQVEELIGKMIRDNLTADEALALSGANVPPDDPRRLRETLGLALDYRDRLALAPREIENALRALEGRFVSPGPGADPVRNPAGIPTGRNLFALNPEEVPTRQAWEVAVELVDELLRQRPVRKVALDLNAFETMRDYGVTEAEALYLMGVRPIWDANNLAVDLEVIDRGELNRPRVDVFIAISGSMRDNFPSRVKLLDQAVRMVSALDEPENHVRTGTLAREKFLQSQGFSSERVAELAPARIFGTRPGEYGTRILYLVPKSGAWDDRREIAEVYKQTMSYAFTGDTWGEQVPGLYEQAASGSEVVLRTWTSNMMSPLTNHHVYEYAGGLSLAIESVTGQQPQLLFNDVRDKPALRDFDEIVATEAHVTMLNPRWIQGMTENGYAGAGMMAEVVRNTFGWEAVRTGSVSQAMWDEIHAVYIRDKHGLHLREWLEKHNPHALQEIAAIELEAHRKGYWQADAETLHDLAQLYATSVARHGPSNGLTGGGNQPLREFVSETLAAPADRDLLASFDAAHARLGEAPSDVPPPVDDAPDIAGASPQDSAPPPSDSAVDANAAQVQGYRMETAETPQRPPTWLWLAAGAAFVLLSVVVGARWRIGAP